MRKLGVLALVIVAVVACGKPFNGPPLANADYKIYEAVLSESSSGIAVIDTHSQSVSLSLPMGTLSSNLHHLYATSADQLRDIDPQTGSALRSMRMPRAYRLPNASISGAPGGLSQNERWLTLESLDNNGTKPPTASHFLVVSTTFDSVQKIDLKGWWEFDAISNDGQRLYLIEYVGGPVYRVRVYDVPGHQLNPTVVVDKSNPNEVMTGQRLMGVPSRDGHWLYSIYARAKDSPFIHALNLDAPFALCIDLPGHGYDANAAEFDWSLALSGGRLYAANSELGVVDDLRINDGAPQFFRTASIAAESSSAGLVQNVEAKEIGRGAAVVSRDGSMLATAGNHGVTLVDTTTLHVRKQSLTLSRIQGLGLTPDGHVLYAATSDQQIVEVSMTSGTVGAGFDPGAGWPIAILAVTGPAA